ncbi:conserved hypothetical protein [Histoplasma mississippiense (nom. inval.)]|uniref:conserved hypothetical protein n=1 Tax=Ajellomyces capsulatus (strain NAm1 / WU24) TaxID=2059318 RepID=UPI000157B84B|nr:conserved hypothetical protein [Histoplasma mississippiense (nom. inval.)]EDN03721.1 conserved hypothetical protein [Histoplasma mississippiense (nom. inval.)]
MDSREQPPDILVADRGHSENELSRETSPGGEPTRINGGLLDDHFKKARNRPRTYPYFKYLPYTVEDESERQRSLEEILEHLYIAVESGDFNPGAVHWTRELKGWLSLKFDPTREQRIKLVKFYYELALAPGVDPNVAERFASMFMLLTKEIKIFVLPSQSGLVHSTNLKRNIKTLTKLCAFAQPYFDPLELPVMLEEFLPHFSTSFIEGAFVVIGLMNLFLPTTPPLEDREDLLPQHYLPTYFHLWPLVNRSRTFDVTFTDLLSRMARDALPASYIPFSEFGIFTSEQTTLIFTAILRLMEIPVGQATSPYSSGVDSLSGLGLMLERDFRKHPFTHNIARWIVMSLSPACLETEHSILSKLEGLIEAVETFFHPSNTGVWSKALSQLVYYLADFFVMRWNMEHDKENEVPPERRVFTLLENLPDAARVRSGSPEENVVNTLPATLMPLLASLSPELYDQALIKIVNFVSGHVIHPARDAMAFICNSVCKVNPEKALKSLVPLLIQSIRTEIDENGAASTRTTGSDILPRDRGLVWNVNLFDIAIYMQQKCKGIPTVHVSNFIHHLLLNLTATYVIDHSLYEPDVKEKGVQVEQWGQRHDPNHLTIKWHVPQREELEFAVELFKSQAENALDQLTSLTSETPSINRDGSGKEWSDEVTRKLVLLRLIISGISMLFDNKAASYYNTGDRHPRADLDVKMSDANDSCSDEGSSEDDSALDGSDDSAVRQTFQYPTGYLLKEDDPLYISIHEIRRRVGEVLHNVHRFLVEKQEDDVSCFPPLYTAYRSWFVDVGIEKSAHILDRVTKLLAADTQPYKVSGVRKDYPRPLLVRRANVYHVQRLRHNASPRSRSKLDETLLLDLAESSVSLYTDIRRSAQGASESALKAIWGSRLLIIPTLIKALQIAIKTNDYRRLKGAIYSILFSSIAKPVGRHWKYAPSLIKAFIEANAVDKPSIQKLCSGAVYQIMDYGRPMERMAVLDQDIIKSIAPKSDVQAIIDNKREALQKKRALIEQKKAELSEELTDLARVSHWKMASRTAAIVIGLGLRFDYVASENLVNLIIQGSIDSHPSLRGIYSQTLVALFTMVDVRAVCSHKYENYIMGVQRFPSKIQVATQPYKKGWTEEYLASFARPEAEYYVDHDYPGWLVWGKTMPAYKSNIKQDIEYDELEWNVRKQMGKLCTREWFAAFFKYLKQEPRDIYADKFRMSSAMTLLYVFELMLRDELTAATFEDIKEEIAVVFEDGSDKHQHRATAEILGALIGSVTDTSVDKRTLVWEYAFPIVRRIFSDGLTPENSGYWTTFVHMIMQCRDPRRLWPLLDWLTSFRLDMNSNAAFKESSKINLLHQCILDVGWHFQLEKPIVADFLAHLDHPYKGVREAIGHTLGSIYRTRYHESYENIQQLIQAQKEASSIGTRPYKPSKEFADTIVDVFSRLERWRGERVPGQQTPSSYTSGSKTVLLWLDSTLSSHECTQLLQFFPGTFTEELLHMMDVKEDQELQRLAYHVFRHLSNIPHPSGDDSEFVESLIRIGLTSSSWHQRLRVMINIQIMYFRRLFLLSKIDREKLFDCIACMLEDTQPEVRAGASATLSGMIRCSPASLRNDMVLKLRDRFTKALTDNPLPKKSRHHGSGVSSGVSTGASTPNPENTRLVLTRHAAVLGLGALIQAFPYTSPPPQWMPDVLITLSHKAAGDPGIVGQSVKSIISDFKKTRQDTWHIDVKAFKPDQVEDLAGVLWKSYFA